MSGGYMVPDESVFSQFLRLAFIRSPGYQAGVSGWTINQDGSAEFNNLTIRNGEIISGTALYYSGGVPAAGKLVASIAAANGTDSVGNAFLQGVTSYDPASFTAANLQGGIASFLTAASQAGPYTSQGFVTASANALEVFGGNNQLTQGQLVAGPSPVAQQVTSGLVSVSALFVNQGITVPDPTAGAPTVETRHAVPFTSGWAGDNGGTLQVELMPDGMVELQGPFAFTSTSTGQSISSNNQFTTALPAAYIPAFQQRVPVFLWDGTLPSLTRNPNRSEHILVNTNGQLLLEWTSGGASTAAGQTARYFASGAYRLN